MREKTGSRDGDTRGERLLLLRVSLARPVLSRAHYAGKFKIAFISNSKRQFVPRDQVLPVLLPEQLFVNFHPKIFFLHSVYVSL